jgi:hypothetical protein
VLPSKLFDLQLCGGCHRYRLIQKGRKFLLWNLVGRISVTCGHYCVLTSLSDGPRQPFTSENDLNEDGDPFDRETVARTESRSHAELSL